MINNFLISARSFATRQKLASVSVYLLSIWALSFIITMQASAIASSTMRGVSYLIGVEAIQVGHKFAGNVNILPLKNFKTGAVSPFVEASKEVFINQKWLRVDGSIQSKGGNETDLVYLDFIISAREVSYEGKTIKLAGVSFQLWKPQIGSDDYQFTAAAQTIPVSYSFIVPNSVEEFDLELKAAVRYLTDYLPAAFEMAHNKSLPKP